MDFYYLDAVLQGVLMDVLFGSMAVYDFYEPYRIAALVEQADVGAHCSDEFLPADAGNAGYEVYRKLFATLVAFRCGAQVPSQVPCCECLNDGTASSWGV
jgi:hypothetical protein